MQPAHRGRFKARFGRVSGRIDHFDLNLHRIFAPTHGI
jgi:hypothetical protein